MDWVSVSSSNISAIAHESNPDMLYVEFHNGTTYQYEGVSVDKFQEMLDAPSQGVFLNTDIKGTYPYNKI